MCVCVCARLRAVGAAAAAARRLRGPEQGERASVLWAVEVRGDMSVLQAEGKDHALYQLVNIW